MNAGNYVFRVAGDSGFRLWVNGVLRIDRADNRSTSTATASINLTAGQQANIRLEYYGLSNRSLIRLDWRQPGAFNYSAIPAEQLSPV
jgi:hypothetical protein